VDATYAGGGGAGGSVYLWTPRIEGGGVISATGGDGGSAHNGGGGGGGRIAVWRAFDNNWSGTLSYPDSVLAGIRGDTTAQDGTLVWGNIRGVTGTIFLVR
jgi:hypothetical protein